MTNTEPATTGTQRPSDAATGKSVAEILEPFVLTAQRSEQETRARANRARDEVARLRRALVDAEKVCDEAVRESDDAQRFLLQVWDHFRDSATRER